MLIPFWFLVPIFLFWGNLCQELLQEAAKARISRMTKQKKKRTDLNVPKFVIDRWNSGTSAKDEMADLLLQVNNDKETF